MAVLTWEGGSAGMQTRVVFSRCQAQQPDTFCVSLAVQMHLLQVGQEHPGLELPLWAQGSVLAAGTSRLPGELSASVPDPAKLHRGVPGLQPVPPPA